MYFKFCLGPDLLDVSVWISVMILCIVIGILILQRVILLGISAHYFK